MKSQLSLVVHWTLWVFLRRKRKKCSQLLRLIKTRSPKDPEPWRLADLTLSNLRLLGEAGNIHRTCPQVLTIRRLREIADNVAG